MPIILHVTIFLFAFQLNLLQAFQFSFNYFSQSRVTTSTLDLNRDLPRILWRQQVFQYQGTANGAHSVKVVLEDFPQILQCIELFQKLYDQKKIPSSFVVPELEDWPKELQGFRLGKRLEKILGMKSFSTLYPDFSRQLSKAFGVKESELSPLNMLTDDWLIIYDAIRTYHSLYHHVRIPGNFIVPRSEPWPKLAYDLKLGLRVAAIRNIGRYVRDYPLRREQLEQLGFDWRGREQLKESQDEIIFEKIIDALKIYYETFNNVMVPPSFVITPKMKVFPSSFRGFPLGKYLNQIKYDKKFLLDRPDRVEALTNLGVHLKFEDPVPGLEEQRQEEAKLISLALKEFRKHIGRIPIPRFFVVPSAPPWPSETWGLPLGEKVAEINANAALIASAPRKNRPKLGTQLFDSGNEVSGSGRSPSMSDWKGENENESGRSNDVNLDDIIDDEDDLEFSSQRSKESRDHEYEEGDDEEEEDEEDGESPRTRAQIAAEEALMVALGEPPLSSTYQGKTYYQLHPDYDSFFEREVTDFNPFKINDAPVYREFAAEAFNQFEEDYVNGAANPRDQRFRFFQHFMDFSQMNRYLYKDIPEADLELMHRLKHRMVEFDEYYWDDVLLALKVYKVLFHQLQQIPTNFIFDDKVYQTYLSMKKLKTSPSSEVLSPLEQEVFGLENRKIKELISMKLGEYVQDLRAGDVDGFEDPERRQILDQLGFTWGDPLKYLRFRFVPMAAALQLMYKYYATTFVEEDYVIPATELWPEWMQGMELGKWCAIARIQQNILRRYYPDRYQILSDLGFIWWTGYERHYTEYSEPPV